MNKKILLSATAMVASLLLSGCSEAPTPAKVETEAKKEPAKAPEAVTAQLAFYEMYKPARTWATDPLALSVTSGEVPNIKNEGGKAGLWTAIFVSPSRREARSFTYAVVDNGDIRKGVNISNALPWGGATKESKPFSNSEFAVDSDAAYKVAADKAEAPWLKAHPGEKATLRLGNASRFAAPIWYIMWGSTKGGYAALVNATTGAIVEK
jgi:hypothetical protein